jgi:hypothetical protein
MTALFLILLALLDAAFAGFRDAAGRNPLLHKSRYYGVAMVKGGLVGLMAVGVIAASVGAGLMLSQDTASAWSDCQMVGLRMAQVFGLYASIAIGALVVYAIPRPEISSLVTVLILGPFTLLRPLVIAAGVTWAFCAAPGSETFFFAATAGLIMGTIEKTISILKINPRDLEHQIAMR